MKGRITMKRNLRRILGLGLSILMLSSSGCFSKKKQKETGAGESSEISSREENIVLNKGQFVKAEDAFFETKEIPLQLPLDSDKKVKTIEYMDTLIRDDQVICGYLVEYEGDIWVYGIAVFTREGELKKNVILPEGEILSSITPGKEGELLVVSVYGADGKRLRLHRITADSKLEKILDFSDNVYFGADAYFTMLDDGSYLAHCFGTVFHISASGELLDEMSVPNSQHTMVRLEDGFYCGIFEWNDDYTEEVLSIQKIDLKEWKTEGEKTRIDSKWLYNFAQTGKDCYHADINGIYKLDMKAGTSSLIVSWNETDCVPGIMRDPVFFVPSSDEVLFIKKKQPEERSISGGSENVLIRLTRAEKNPYAGKRILTAAIAGEGEKEVFQEIMKQYNTDPKSTSRIQIVDYNSLYGIYGSSETEEDLLDRINQEILSGTGPDILINCAGYPRFSTSGRMADMNPYFDGNNGISRDDYYDNIFRAYETDGKLYQVPVYVEMSGLLYNDALLGNKHTYSLSDLLSAGDVLPSDKQLLPVYSCEEILDMLLPVMLSSFVSDETGTCSFDSPEFKDLLEFCRKYGQPQERLERNGGAWVDPVEYLNAETVAAVPYSVNHVMQYSDYAGALRGQALFGGYPLADSSGVGADTIMSVGVAAASSGKEEAFGFVRYLLSPETQVRLSHYLGGFPVHRASCKETTEQLVSEYALFITAPSDPSMAQPGKYYVEEKVVCEGIPELMGKVSAASYKDPFIQNIVKEEAAAFFNNQKSAEEVSGSIQNRAKIVVQERSF